jgi:hypothetical protein
VGALDGSAETLAAATYAGAAAQKLNRLMVHTFRPDSRRAVLIARMMRVPILLLQLRLTGRAAWWLPTGLVRLLLGVLFGH